MEKVKKKGKVEREIIGYVWIYAFVVCGVMLIVTKGSFVLPISFLLGTFTNLLCFTITIKSVDKIIYDEKLNAKAEYTKANIRKMIVYAVVLALAAYSYFRHSDKTIHLNFYATAAGFFSVKIMIYFKSFVLDKIFLKKNQDINENKEQIKVNNNEIDEISSCMKEQEVGVKEEKNESDN